ncbi:GIY-YIG nuclease family protein [Mucilaginibacter rigui]|uniref:GIY-YIG nuclease family protein n=1 Tax=Mucilaginibacter rigui TaxID=534635 RepID=UPI00293B8F75|nr:GIY-YIG nuclease family protein [Mucilaginibacter rigui]
MKIYQYYVYIITNDFNNVLYTGVTSNLAGRVLKHKETTNKVFSARYHNVANLFITKTFNGCKMP